MASDPIDDILSNRGNRESWGAILSNLAGMIQNIPRNQADIAARNAQAFSNQMLAADRMQQVQARQQSADDLKAIDAAFATPGTRDEFLSRLPGHLRGKISKDLSEIEEAHSKQREMQEKARLAADDTVARALATLPTYNYDPQVAQGVISTLKRYYADDPERSKEIADLEAQLHANPTPEFVKQTVDALITRSGTQRKAEEAATKAKNEAEEARQKIEGTQPIQPTEAARIADAQARAAASQAATAAQQAETARHNRATEASSAAAQAEAARHHREQESKQGAGKPATGAQAKTLGYFNRLKQADEELKSVEDQIASLGFTAQEWLKHAPNWAQTELGQKYIQAQRTWSEARLRRDSGATIRQDEYADDARTNFVQPGDSAAVIAQKRRSRAAALGSMAYEAGPAFDGYYGDEADALREDYRARAKGQAHKAAATEAPKNPFRK